MTAMNTIDFVYYIYLDLVESKVVFLGKLIYFLTLASFPVDAVSKLFQG